MSTTDDKDPPKLPLLIKFMGMTGSDHDGEALAAMRKANALLASAGWSWERLLNGKVTVIADPFQSIPEPASDPHRRQQSNHGQSASAPPKPRPARPTAAPPPPPPGWSNDPQSPPPQQRTTSIFRSTRINSYVGHCWCCGAFVAAGDGFIVSGRDLNAVNPKITSAKKWETLCNHHNSTSSYVPARRASKQQASASTILNSI